MKLDIVTPDRRLNSVQGGVSLPADVDAVVLPGESGQMEILPGHAPLLALLGTGVLSFSQGGKMTSLVVSGGFAEVDRDGISVMCELAALSEEIDAAAEQSALTEAQVSLSNMGAVAETDAEFRRIRAEAERAAAKLSLG